MGLYIFFGLLNGCCIALSRILNGQLSASRGAFKASFVNHIVGFSLLSVLVLIWFGLPAELPTSTVLYSGGVIGALYVAVNSFVMTRLGATHAIVLVIAGQMLFSLGIDAASRDTMQSESFVQELFGASLIVLGIAAKEFIAKLGKK